MNPQTLYQRVEPLKNHLLKANFLLFTYNIQSLSNKIDIIESELRDFDAICLTETWLDRRTSDEIIKINEPSSNNLIYSSIEDSIGLAFDTNIANITITGDFNFDVSKPASCRKINDLCQQFDMDQIKTENSDSIIDLFLV